MDSEETSDFVVALIGLLLLVFIVVNAVRGNLDASFKLGLLLVLLDIAASLNKIRRSMNRERGEHE